MAFSVVIPTFNSSKCISKALESIEHQTPNMDYEIIIVDDKSDDIENLTELLKKYKNTSLIKKEIKTNAADSRNTGIKAAKFEYVFLLDSDDQFNTNSIAHRIDLHQKTGAGIIFGNFIKNDGTKRHEKFLPNYEGKDIRDYIFIQGGDFRSSTISICKKNYKGTLFDPKSQKHQDWIFAAKCQESGEAILKDEHLHAILDTSRNGRMSSKMNIHASSYFLDNYIAKKYHANIFISKHLKSALKMGDTEAAEYFLSKYTPNNNFELITIKTIKKTFGINLAVKIINRFFVRKNDS